MVEMKKINLKELILPDYNPRHITPEAFESLKRSITEFGYVTPLVVNTVNNHVVGGNQRVKALLELGYEAVECAIVEINDINEEKALNIRLNNNSGDWDIGKLDNIFNDLELSGFDATLTGFNTDRLQPFESSKTTTEIPTSETITSDINTGLKTEKQKKEIKNDNYKEPENEIKITVATGDIYQLGNHRLMCGDSTNINNLDKLMNGEKADITFTSPPYNTQQGMKGNPLSTQDKYGLNNYYTVKDDGFAGNVYNSYEDNLNDDDYSKLLIRTVKNALEYSDDVLYNIGVLKGNKHGICNLLYEFQDNLLDILVWNKNNALPLGLPTQKRMVSHICELIFCFNQKGNRSFTHSQWEAGTKNNRIDSNFQSNNEYSKIHNATFPIDFASEIIQDFTENSVLDLFGGTGTTLIACEQTDRKCYMMELDPYYCQIIINRWEDFSGETAVKIN